MAPKVKISAMNGIGGPHARAERPAVAPKKISQAVRIGFAQYLHQNVVAIVKKLRIPKPT
jgi:hypothetical protein